MAEAAYIIALHLRDANKDGVQTGQTPDSREMAELSRLLTRALKLSNKLAENVRSREYSTENPPKLLN
jgi:hypothetical protein